MVNGWIIAVLGLWTGITPFFGASPYFYAWNDWIVGAIVAVVGFMMASRRPTEGWISGLIGVWLFISGFIGNLLLGAGLWWNNILVGLALIVFGLAATRATTTTTRTTTA